MDSPRSCRQLSRTLALDLIEELEKTVVVGKLEERSFKEDVEWMEKLIEVHPVLRKLPQHVKSNRVVSPGQWSDLPDFNVRASWLTCLQVRTMASHLLERGINKEEMAMPYWRLTSQ